MNIFVRSGYVEMNRNTLRYFGIYGRMWSQTAALYNTVNSEINAYFLHFNVPDTAPSGGPYHRWEGFPVRCLVY